jgi:hypothetical protein
VCVVVAYENVFLLNRFFIESSQRCGGRPGRGRRQEEGGGARASGSAPAPREQPPEAACQQPHLSAAAAEAVDGSAGRAQ